MVHAFKEATQRLEQSLLLRRAEAGEEFTIQGTCPLRAAGEQFTAGQGKCDLLPPAVILGLDPSHGAESLQLVQEGDDEAGSDVHDPGEFSLGTALGSSEQREQAYVLGLELQIPDGRDEPPGELGSQQTGGTCPYRRAEKSTGNPPRTAGSQWR